MSGSLIRSAVLALVFFTGWLVNGWRLGGEHEQYRREQAEKLLEARQQIRRQEYAHRRHVETIDQDYQQELTDAQDEIDRLRADVQRGAVRLSVPAKCERVPGNTGAASRTHATGRAELDPGATAEILALTERGDRAIRQLSALQEYVREVCVRGGSP